jgi:hypothetical protein
VTVHSPERKERGLSHCAAATPGSAKINPPLSRLRTLREAILKSPKPSQVGHIL